MPLLPRRDFVRLSTLAGLAAVAPARSQEAGAKPPKIRIGQIGTGHAHAAGKMETIRKSEDFELVGVVEDDPELRARAEKNKVYAGVPWMTSDQLLETRGLQAVAVETQVADLLRTASLCVGLGKHIHLDKPAGESLPQFKKLLDESVKQQRIIQMGYMFRYNPAFQLCFRLLQEGALGEVFSIDTAMSKRAGAGERKPLLRYRGGSMFELGGHVIDAAVTVLGRPAKVTPYMRNASKPETDDGLSDNDLAVLEYPRATVTVRSALVEVEGTARRNFIVCGSKGTLDIHPLEPPAGRLALDAPHGEYKKGYQDVTFPKSRGRYDSDFADLAKAIRGEKPFAFNPEHDLAVQETLLLACGLPID
jgi:predicted dehydrogenase